MIPQKKYIKKVIVLNEASSPEARAERLRRVRNMANLSRERMCNDEALNINTYKGWEIARYGGLPVDGAEKVIKRVTKEGVVCTANWLLHGAGLGPYVIPQYQQASPQTSHIRHENPEQISILNETELFKEQFPGAVIHEITDDGLTPYYHPGDMVGGIPHYQEELKKLLGKNCIVQLETGQLLTRQLKQSDVPGKYTLICTNVQTSIQKPILYDVTLVNAAPIIRHYRKNQQD